MPTTSIEPPTGPSRLEAAARLSIVGAVVLALATILLALVVSYESWVSCGSLGGCLGKEPSWLLAAHVAGGAILGLVIFVALVLTWLQRQEHPWALRYAVGAFVLVLIMGGIGMGLAAGSLPPLALAVQTGLALVLLLLLFLTDRGLQTPAEGASAPSGSGPGSPRSTA